MTGFDEQDYEIMYALGHTMYTQRRFTDAARVFGFLMTHNHRDRRYLQAYAATLHMTQDYANAIRVYTYASLLDGADPDPALHICECLVALGLRKEAAEGLTIVVGLCEADDSYAALRERAQALLGLLTQHPTSQTMEKTQ
jgi:type III secretion system low calcium response chaperone LcrH/SycD